MFQMRLLRHSFGNDEAICVRFMNSPQILIRYCDTKLISKPYIEQLVTNLFC